MHERLNFEILSTYIRPNHKIVNTEITMFPSAYEKGAILIGVFSVPVILLLNTNGRIIEETREAKAQHHEQLSRGVCI